jgi:hypothetical protein
MQVVMFGIVGEDSILSSACDIEAKIEQKDEESSDEPLEVSSLMEQLVSICNQPAPDLSAENG